MQTERVWYVPPKKRTNNATLNDYKYRADSFPSAVSDHRRVSALTIRAVQNTQQLCIGHGDALQVSVLAENDDDLLQEIFPLPAYHLIAIAPFNTRPLIFLVVLFVREHATHQPSQ